MALSDCNQPMPHDDVYTRIGVSTLDSAPYGLGVFAIRHIKKGTNPFMHIDSTIVWVKDEEVQKLSEEVKKLYEVYGVLKGGYWGVPPNFNQLKPIWFLNNSENPNMRCDIEKGYLFFAMRNIYPGEELTAEWSTYSEDY